MGRKPPSNLAAYECWLRGAKYHEQETPNAYAKARKCYEESLALDPDFARAHAGLAELAYMDTVFAGWGTERAEDHERAHAHAMKAVELDPTDARPHYVLGMILMARGDWEAARRHWDLSAELDANDADATMCRATALAYLGDPDAGFTAAQLAMRLNPHYPDWYISDLGVILFAQHKYRELLESYGRIPELYPHTPAWKAAAAAYLGLEAEARQYAASFLSNAEKAWAGKPKASPSEYVAWFVKHVPIKLAADKEHLVQGLRKAGLPI